VRILHTEASLGWGGQEIRILTEAAGMIARGHSVELVCAPDARIFSEAGRYGVRANALPVARKRPFGLLALARFLSKHPVDVIDSHSSTDSWLSALACGAMRIRRKRPPALVRTRHISAAVPRDAMTRWLYGKATAEIVTTGEAIREHLVRDLGVAPERVTSIPTGIDTVRFAPGDKITARRGLGLPADVPLVGIVATLRSWKGHRFLIDAVPLLAHRETQVLIIGEGPQREALLRQIGELGVTGRVRLVGNQTDVVPWLTALDVFALPSYANEGVPQALLQAMLVGVPCVTTNVGAIGEAAIPDHTALVVAKQNAVALAAGIDRLLGDSAIVRRLTLAARERALAKFSLDAMLDRMEAVLVRAVHEQRRA